MFGFGETTHQIAHVMVFEYIPFLLLLAALFTTCGGIVIRGNIHATPLINTGILGVGALLASIMGTTGAAMVLIRPLLRLNHGRANAQHLVIFFIFLVANIGGSLTPIGDPPLFLGYLKGVSFFWTTIHLLPQFLLSVGILLLVFYGLDSYYFKRDITFKNAKTKYEPIHLAGDINVFLLLLILAVVIMFGSLASNGHIIIYGMEYPVNDLLRNGFLLAIILASIKLTPPTYHEENGFSFEPIIEVAKLFFGIFICLLPIIAILNERGDGALAGLFTILNDKNGQPNPTMYFWLTGILSSFLDNAPTYLVFFNAAGGNANHLMGEGAIILSAISAGAVFMGANSYIGNAPNFMVKSIAENRHIKMPSFFGYCLWALLILIPLFIINSLVFYS